MAAVHAQTARKTESDSRVLLRRDTIVGGVRGSKRNFGDDACCDASGVVREEGRVYR